MAADESDASTIPLGPAEALSRLAAARDPSAWEALLRQLGGDVMRLARRLTGDAQLADDAVQETLLRLRDHAGDFRFAYGPSADAAARRWVLTVAAHTAIDLLRRQRLPHRHAHRLRERARLAPLPATPEEQVVRAEEATLLRHELARLPEASGRAIAMHHLTGMSFEEIASELHMPVGTVKTRVRRGLICMRRRLERRGIAWSLAMPLLALDGLPETPGSALRFAPLLTKASAPASAPLMPAIVWPLAIVCALVVGAAAWCAQTRSAGTLPAASRTLVVAPSGSENGDGSAEQPFASIAGALRHVRPGDTVLVRDGIYRGDGSAIAEIGVAGSEQAWITIAAEHRGGAQLDGRGNATACGFTLLPTARWIAITGFDVGGFEKAGISVRADHVRIAGNRIHDIGRESTDQPSGLAGIYAEDVADLRIEDNRIHDVGRYRPGDRGFAAATRLYENHDCGIILSGVRRAVIAGNVLHNHRCGWAIQLYSDRNRPCADIAILANTFAFANPDRDGHICIARPGVSHATISGNVFLEPRGHAIQIGADAVLSDVSADANLTYPGSLLAAVSPGCICTANLDATDPLLCDPAGGDFRLRPSSPAIDAGRPLAAGDVDQDGVHRPQGRTWDIGAFEHPDLPR